MRRPASHSESYSSRCSKTIRTARSRISWEYLLVLAMNREKAAFRIYTNLASIATEKECHDVLLGLAQEEAQHKLRLEIEYDLTTF